jgi:hypothetical protein
MVPEEGASARRSLKMYFTSCSSHDEQHSSTEARQKGTSH